MSAIMSCKLALIRKLSLYLALLGVIVSCGSNNDTKSTERTRDIETLKDYNKSKLNQSGDDDDEDEDEDEDDDDDSSDDDDGDGDGNGDGNGNGNDDKNEETKLMRAGDDNTKSTILPTVNHAHKVEVSKIPDRLSTKDTTTVKVTSPKPEKNASIVTYEDDIAVDKVGDDAKSTVSTDIDIDTDIDTDTDTNSNASMGDFEVEEDSSEYSAEEFSYGGCKSYSKFKFWRWFKQSRYGVECFPKDYKLSLINTKTNCANNMIRDNRILAQRSPNRPKEAQAAAKMMGSTTNNTSTTSCNIRTMRVAYYPYRWPLFFRRMGIKRRCWKACKSVCDPCPKWRDRIAFVDFCRDIKWKNVLKRPNISWGDPCIKKLCGLNDMYINNKKDDCTKNFPKVSLELIVKTTYIYDPEQDIDPKCGKRYCYEIPRKHKELLDNALCNSKKVHTSAGGSIHEKCIKRFEYCNYNCSGRCKKSLFGLGSAYNRIRSRHGLIFMGRNEGCSEPKCASPCDDKSSECEEIETPTSDCCDMSFKTIRKLRGKGANGTSWLWGSIKKHNWIRSSRRVIHIEKIDCEGCKTREEMAVVDFVWRLTVKDENGNKKVLETEMGHYWT